MSKRPSISIKHRSNFFVEFSAARKSLNKLHCNTTAGRQLQFLAHIVDLNCLVICINDHKAWGLIAQLTRDFRGRRRAVLFGVHLFWDMWYICWGDPLLGGRSRIQCYKIYTYHVLRWTDV